MKRVKNLTGNKVLINTFKKLKTRTHLNKNNLKNFSFYLIKYNRLVFLKFFKKTNLNCVFLKKFFLNKVALKQSFFSTNNKPIANTILMFIN
jgi:hypothetical protein